MASRRPNILLILTDQQRIDTLGCYGNAAIRTPHVDALASEGVRYENSFCPYPTCTASRYSLITGLYVHEHRSWNNNCTLRPGLETFPRLLQRAGYKTKAVGKMHYHPTYADLGFDEMLLAEQNGPGRWDDDYHRDLRRLGLIDRNDLEDQETEFRKTARDEYWETLGALPSNLPEEHHSTTWIGNHSVRALEHWNAASPSLLVASFIKPHHPHDPPHPWSEMYDPKTLPLLPGWTEELPAPDRELNYNFFKRELTEEKLRRIMACYYANVSQIDFHVGRMIDVLKRKGLYENTLILYTSDHGEYLGHHHQVLKGGYMYDPLIKVPLIVKFPWQARGSNANGSASTALISNVDLAPTILAQAGCTPDQGMRGLNLTNIASPRDIICAEAVWTQPHLMARSHSRKLLVNLTNQKRFFYDLERDPQELQNVADRPEYQSEIRRFEQALLAWRGSLDPLPGKCLVDEAAPIISGSNVPSREDNHRAELQEYTRQKMAER